MPWEAWSPADLVHRFPRLRTEGYDVKSPVSVRYNCIAWAAGDDTRWWEPTVGYFWPADVPREFSVDAYVKVFESRGYERCAGTLHEPGFERVAIYTDDTGEPVHVSRELTTGRWVSKMSLFEDIEHATAESLTGDAYTNVTVVLRRRLQT